MYLKHFYDSLSASFFYRFKNGQKLLDIGAGAGFPSIPLKIVFPDLHVSIVDSLNKRITFLKELANELALESISFYHGRAEDLGQDPNHREQYDLVTARAVARMSVLAELCLPFVKKGGSFIAMKGAGAADELKQAQSALKLLGGVLESDHQLRLPLEESERHIIIVKKRNNTPNKYPRKPGIPNKQPL